MPRTRGDNLVTEKPITSPLIAELAKELQNPCRYGQPTIHEQVYPRSETIHAKVFWDRWANIDLEKRIKIILEAYQQTESEELTERITLVSGYTIPEGFTVGELPYEVRPVHRKSDHVSLEQCRQAMIECGASILANPELPELRFPTIKSARECKNYLVEKLPGSDEIWAIVNTPHQYYVDENLFEPLST